MNKILKKRPNGYWTKEKCVENSLKYNSKSEWENNSGSAYLAARKNKWLDDCSKHMMQLKKSNGYWTKENCILEALKYKTRAQWSKNSKGSYSAARKNQWLDDCSKHMLYEQLPNGFWTKKRCIQDSLKYNSRIEWFRNSSAYKVASKKQWMEECCQHMKPSKTKKKWTQETCFEIAKQYNTRSEWQKNSAVSYKTAREGGWLEICCKHMIKLGSRFKRLIYCFEFPDNFVYVGLTFNLDKRKISHFLRGSVFEHIVKTKLQPTYKKLSNYMDRNEASIKETEFVEKYKKEGWNILNKAKPGGLGGDILKWTRKACIEESKKYKKRSELAKFSKGAYESARKNGWLNDCIKLN